MKLHRVKLARFIGHTGDGAGIGRGHQLETRRQRGDLVAVAHPHVEHAVTFGRHCILNAVEQFGVPARAHLSVTKFALVARFDGAAQLHGHGEHAVANAQHRHPLLIYRLWCAQILRFVGAGVAARENDALGTIASNEFVRDVVGVDFGIHPSFTHATRDELRDLGAEVENQNFAMHRRKKSQRMSRKFAPAAVTNLAP